MERKTVEVLWPSVKEETVEKKSEKLRVAAYCRASDIYGDDKRSSLENQMDYYSKYILQHEDYKLVGIYYDSGVSGMTVQKRPGFKRLIRHCLEGRIDVVITKSISRFSRNSKDLLETVELLKEHNITVIFEKEKIDSMKTRNKFFLTALSAVYQQESLEISANNKLSAENRNKMGRPIFRNQYGYRVVEIDGRKTFEIVDEEARAIKYIYKRFLEGNSTTKIALELTESGIRTPSGNEIWRGTSIKNILTNNNYLGDRLTNEYVSLLMERRYIRNEGQENRYYIKNTHPAIIDEESFHKVQEMLESKQVTNKPPMKSYPLSKRIICAYCGWPYYHSEKRNKHRWKCGLKGTHATLCESNSLVETTLNEMMKRALDERYDFQKPGALKRLKQDLERLNNNDRFELHRMSNLMSLLSAKEELAISEGIERDLLIAKVEKIESEILAFEDLASKIEEDRVYRENALEMIVKSKTLEDFIKSLDASILRAWIMEISVLTKNDFKVRWLDDSYEELGDYISTKEKRSFKLSESKKQKAGISIFREVDKEPIEDKMTEKRDDERRGEEVEIIEIQNKPSTELIDKIKKKYKESATDILKIEPKKTKKKIRVGVYARVSTREPDQLGSLEAQVAFYTFALLKDPNNQLVRIYADEGVSGTNAKKRSGFQKMIKDCENGKIDRIVTKSISRFARNTVDALEYVRKLKEYKVSIFFEKEGIDTAKEDGEVLLTVYSALAQEESRSLGESISWGKKALAKRGIVRHNARTYGYDFNKDRSWYIVEEEAKVVRSIFERYINGIRTPQISRDLTIEGIPTMKEGSSWDAKRISTILNNISYTGDLLYQKNYTKDTFTSRSKQNFGEVSQLLIEDHHPAIIDRETWHKAQSIMEKRRNPKTNSKRSHDKEEFFSRFLCSNCGNFYAHVLLKTKHKWRCKASLKKEPLACCEAGYIEEPEIIKQFMKMLIECKKDSSFKSLIEEKIEEKSLTRNEKQLLSYLEEEIQKRYQVLYKVVEAGGKSGEDTVEIKKHTDGIMAVQDKINEIIDKEDEYKFLVEEKEWLMKELDNLPDKKKLDYRNDIFKRIIKDGVISSDNIITFNLIFGISKTASK